MCTISWLPTSDGYSLRMNRDELRSRAPGSGPRILDLPLGRAIAPLDPESGGSWIGVTSSGMALTLANLYPDPVPEEPRDPISRGRVLMQALGHGEGTAVRTFLAGADLSRTKPFRLSVFEPGRAAYTASWNGTALTDATTQKGGLIATSSSRDQEGANGIRAALFQNAAEASGGLTEAVLDALHQSREPEPGPYAISMERTDAATVSMSLIRVGAAAVEFTYTPGPPHRTEPESPVVLERLVAGKARVEALRSPDPP